MGFCRFLLDSSFFYFIFQLWDVPFSDFHVLPTLKSFPKAILPLLSSLSSALFEEMPEALVESLERWGSAGAERIKGPAANTPVREWEHQVAAISLRGIPH